MTKCKQFSLLAATLLRNEDFTWTTDTTAPPRCQRPHHHRPRRWQRDAKLSKVGQTLDQYGYVRIPGQGETESGVNVKTAPG